VPNPINEYGRSKLAGEIAVRQSGAAALVLRVSWVYDAVHRNFVTTILGLAAEREELRVVGDQIGCPAWARSVARATVSLLRDLDGARAACGLYHLATPDYVDRHAFVRRLLELTARERAREPRLVRITTPEYPLPAARPLNSALDAGRLRRAFGLALDGWDAQLQACLADRMSRGAAAV